MNSQLIHKSDNQTELEDLKFQIRQGSPLIWHDVNFLGTYDFSLENNQDTVGLELSKIWSEK